MSDWKQKIEAQILEANNFAGRSLTPEEHDAWKDIKASLEDLRDVAVAAEQHTQSIEEGFAAAVRPDIARMLLNRALDKLRKEDSQRGAGG